jgi:hypothetical protein
MGDHGPHRPRDASQRDRDAVAISTTPKDLQDFEVLVRKENWPNKAYELWARIKYAALHPMEMAGPGGAYLTDISEIKAHVQDLTTAVRDLAKVTVPTPQKTASYADMLRKPAAGPPAPREMPVPARRSRELVIAPGEENPPQKQRTGQELVRDLNAKL